MNGMPSGPAVWTILIPTLGQRSHLFGRLMGRLMPQVDAAGGQVKVLAYWNNGQPGLPEIRQRLVETVETEYLSFVDDDDMVPDDFVSVVLEALDERPDYVGWQVRYFSGRRDMGLVDHSLAHGGWREERNPYRLLRDISHINPMRTAIARTASFRVARAGQIEDRPWVQQLRDGGLLKTEVYIPQEMYVYQWDRQVSAWRRPEKIRDRGFAPIKIDSPHFSYHQEVPVTERPKIERLGVIVPTRGRPQNIEKVIGAWDATDAWAVADLILAVDADDPANPGYWLFQQDTRPVEIIEYAQWQPMVQKLNRAATSLAGRYGALGFAGDDHLPRTAGWAAMYLAALEQLGTGMVYGNDGYQGEKLSTEWAITSDVVKALDRMVPAPVDHLYCDNAMMDLFRDAGALRYLPEVRIEHMHPVVGKAERDEQYDRVNSSKQSTADRAAYRRWLIGQKAKDVSAVRALRGSTERTAPSIVSRSARPGRTPRMPRRSPFPHYFRQIRSATPEPVMIALADLAAQVPADQEIVELGVFQGGTALRLAWGAAQGNGAHVTGIDPWDLPGNVYDPPFTDAGSERWARHWVRSFGYGDRVTLRKGMSQDVVTTWTDEPRIGLLFVDGDHTEEGARRDIELWAPHLAPGAVIAVDDYGHPDWPGVAQAVDALVDEGFLAPIELYHDRLAVTKLAVTVSSSATTERAGEDRGQSRSADAVTAITSEGVEPAPVSETVESEGPTLGELRAQARERGIPGATRMKRPELLKALSGE